MPPATSSAGTGLYPPHAFEFIHEGLDYTVAQAHGNAKTTGNRHVTGQQLCEGLRELALSRWGRMARTVLRRWNVTSTLDFGRIVYAQIEMGEMQKVDEDSIDMRFQERVRFRDGFRIGLPHPESLMSKTRESRNQSQSPAKKGATKDDEVLLSSDLDRSPPLKPRRGLFIFLTIVLIALFAGMMGLYFKTVYPYRPQPHATEQPALPPTR